MLSRAIRNQLPKARWLDISYQTSIFNRPAFFYKSRGANFIRYRIWNFVIVRRAPYLEHVAKVNYPNLFAST